MGGVVAAVWRGDKLLLLLLGVGHPINARVRRPPRAGVGKLRRTRFINSVRELTIE